MPPRDGEPAREWLRRSARALRVAMYNHTDGAKVVASARLGASAIGPWLDEGSRRLLAEGIEPGAAALAAIPFAPASAAGRRLIRDAEVENTIRAYATPLFEAAGLNAKDVDIYLIDDPSLNSFEYDYASCK